jgi:hypothetical protein
MVSWVPGSPIDCASDDADRFADLDHPAGGEVAAVARHANAAPGLAGQHRADLDPLDAGGLDGIGELLGDLLADADQQLAGHRIVDLLLADATHDAVAQRLEDVAALHDCRHVDAVDGAAVHLGDDDVLRHVDQTPRQVARVGGLQGGVRQALARAVGRDEVLEHRQAFTEVGVNRRLDDLAGGLRHQAAHAGELANLLARAAGAGVRHHVDGVELAALALDRLHLLEHLLGDLLGDAVPDVDDLVLALAGGDDARRTLGLDLDHLPCAPGRGCGASTRE